MFRILFVVVLLSLGSQAWATTLLVLGDSLSAGYRMSANQSWPHLLDQYWQREGLDLKVINASMSGETTQGGLARLPALLKQHAPDWVLIELGANDGLRGFPPPITQRNLVRMLELVATHQSRAVLTQIRLPRNYGQRYIHLFEAIYPALAEAHDVPLMPFFLEPIITRPELMLDDGIHPRPEAQPLIRDQVATFLTPLLRP